MTTLSMGPILLLFERMKTKLMVETREGIVRKDGESWYRWTAFPFDMPKVTSAALAILTINNSIRFVYIHRFSFLIF